MVNGVLEWILETLKNDKELKVIVETDTFDKFFEYIYVDYFRAPYLNILYIYEFLGSTSDGDYLAIYNIYIIITTDYLPEIKNHDLTHEEKETLLNYIKSISNKE